MNVLSLFDGMSCGQQALERSGIKVDNYYASEIDKYAIKVTMANYPNTIQLGSVVGVDGYKLPKIDLLIGGSPCQSFSFAGWPFQPCRQNRTEDKQLLNAKAIRNNSKSKTFVTKPATMSKPSSTPKARSLCAKVQVAQ